jgi:ribosomal protein S18 acetylase RimI-like enzyme
MNAVTLWDNSQILPANATTEQLQEAVERNVAARAKYFAAAGSMTMVEDNESLQVYSRMTHQVALTRLTPTAADTHIDAIIAQVRRKQRRLTWVVGPASRPADLPERLRRRGFTVDMAEPGMAISLDAVMATCENLLKPVPGLRIEPVHLDDKNDLGMLGLFTRVAEASFKRPISLGAQIRRLIYELPPDSQHASHMRLYVGYLGDKPVASASSLAGGGVVGIYTVGTVPQARGRGLASAMTCHALAEAYHEGLRVGVLHASQQGQGVYTRLGFQTVGRVTWLSASWRTLMNHQRFSLSV